MLCYLGLVIIDGVGILVYLFYGYFVAILLGFADLVVD